MTDQDAVGAFADRARLPDDPSFSVESDALRVDGWWPAALWLGDRTCLVRVDEGPRPGLAAELAAALASRGLHRIEADLDAPVLSVAMQRLDVIAGSFEVWSDDEATARSAIGEAATG